MRTTRKRLRHRVPVRMRHHWRLVVGSIAAMAALAVAIGSLRASPLVYSDAAEAFAVNWDIVGDQDLFDTSVAHEISFEFDQGDYDQMLATFEDSGEKEWIRADVTIDGTTIRDVGMRWKGNSTLAALSGEDWSEAEGFDDAEQPAPDGAADVMEFSDEEQAQSPQSVDPEAPEKMPWLVDFGKFVEGQVYQGARQIALRASTSTGSSSTLTESAALELLEASGEPSYDWTYSRVTVNGSEPVTRRIVDVMDVTWAAEEFGENAGVLYKARARGTLEYQGEDPKEYEDDFKQLNMDGAADMRPIIAFLEWLDEADDEQFDTELDQWIDVDSFANYAALQNLMANPDDMSGPGNNFYLWYDFDTGLISVLTWDLDLSMRLADVAPEDSMSAGGGVVAPAEDGELPEGGEAPAEPPAGMEIPEGAEMPEAGTPEDQMPEAGASEDEIPDDVVHGAAAGNDLKQRFLDSEAFTERYMEAYEGLYDRIYADGTALEAVETVQAAAELNGEDDPEGAASLIAFVEERSQFLEETLAEE